MDEEVQWTLRWWWGGVREGVGGGGAGGGQVPSVCQRYPVEVVQDVGGVSGPEARGRDTDDSHAVRDLHLLLHLRQVVRLALPAVAGGHGAKLHGAVIQPLEDDKVPEGKQKNHFIETRSCVYSCF